LKFIITVDTEADNEWAKPKISTLKNLEYIPRFQELCERYSFKPTYLSIFDVVESSYFKDMMKTFLKSGKAEVGAHLHPWSCPPLEDVTPNDLYYHPYPHELPTALFKKKMERLTTALEQAFNVKPRSYRGGRWGFAPDHIEVLLALGYIVDSSVTPYISWEHHLGDPRGKGGPDYTKAQILPYILKSSDTRNGSSSKLLEVPLTVLFKNHWIRSIYDATGNINIVRKALNKYGFGPRLFWPSHDHNAKQLISVYKSARSLSLPYIQMMIHSSELMPGGSPYNPDNNSIEKLYQRVEELFQYLRSDQVNGVTLGDFALSFLTNQANEGIL
jgi:hypothetical protein